MFSMEVEHVKMSHVSGRHIERVAVMFSLQLKEGGMQNPGELQLLHLRLCNLLSAPWRRLIIFV